MTSSLVLGAGGFIGGHTVNMLVNRGEEVAALDIKTGRQWQILNDKATNYTGIDLRGSDALFYCQLGEFDKVYNFAADMGGMGFIENNKAACMLTVLINTNTLNYLQRVNQRPKYFYASSACVYAADKQTDSNITALKESDAYPAMPEDGYGWEKLFSERMTRHFKEDYGFAVRIGRFHNVYGTHTAWRGGREKAPAAICRKVIEGFLGDGSIEIWGDGEQTRSFMYVDDCVEGVDRLMESSFSQPINIGSSELVSINQLVDVVEVIASKRFGKTVRLDRRYNLDAPKGVRGRNSDNTLIKEVLDWEPSISLTTGLKETFEWIWKEMILNDQSWCCSSRA